MHRYKIVWLKEAGFKFQAFLSRLWAWFKRAQLHEKRESFSAAYHYTVEILAQPRSASGNELHNCFSLL
jgi:hypothetical protein